MFDTARLTRTISSATKRDAILSDIAFPLAGQLIALEEMQHLMGALYDFGQMCPFLQAFRLPLNNFLADLLSDPNLPMPMAPQAMADLRIWVAVVAATVVPLPIPSRPLPPSYSAIQFVSDAAGARYVIVKKKEGPLRDTRCQRSCINRNLRIGSNLVLLQRDLAYSPPPTCSRRAREGKSTTLEMIGVMLPLLTVPHLLRGRELCLL